MARLNVQKWSEPAVFHSLTGNIFLVVRVFTCVYIYTHTRPLESRQITHVHNVQTCMLTILFLFFLLRFLLHLSLLRFFLQYSSFIFLLLLPPPPFTFSPPVCRLFLLAISFLTRSLLLLAGVGGSIYIFHVQFSERHTHIYLQYIFTVYKNVYLHI